MIPRASENTEVTQNLRLEVERPGLLPASPRPSGKLPECGAEASIYPEAITRWILVFRMDSFHCYPHHDEI